MNQSMNQSNFIYIFDIFDLRKKKINKNKKKRILRVRIAKPAGSPPDTETDKRQPKTVYVCVCGGQIQITQKHRNLFLNFLALISNNSQT